MSCTTDELIATLETANSTPFTNTVNELAGAVVALSVSSYDSDNTVPAVFSEAESIAGATTSPATVELFVTSDSVNEIASLPAASCTAALLVAALGVGAV